MPNIADVDMAPVGNQLSPGLPLILLTVVIHVFGPALINQGLVRVLRPSFIPMFAVIMAVNVLWATALQGIGAEAR